MAKRLPSSILRDQAWDVLLELFIGEIEKRETYVKEALLASGLPSTSAVRLLDRLEKADLIARVPDPADHRRVIVSLTESGRSVLVAVLDAISI